MLKAVRPFLQQFNGALYYSNAWILDKQRINDTYIMEEFVKQYNNTKIITLLNRCRMFLQAITLSDMTRSTRVQLCGFALFV